VHTDVLNLDFSTTLTAAYAFIKIFILVYEESLGYSILVNSSILEYQDILNNLKQHFPALNQLESAKAWFFFFFFSALVDMRSKLRPLTCHFPLTRHSSSSGTFRTVDTSIITRNTRPSVFVLLLKAKGNACHCADLFINATEQQTC